MNTDFLDRAIFAGTDPASLNLRTVSSQDSLPISMAGVAAGGSV
jgi:hypothetical protein